MKYAVYSITSDDNAIVQHLGVRAHYSFFAPIAAKLWDLIDYESVVFVAGDSKLNPVVEDYLHIDYTNVFRIPSISKHRDSTVAQVSRLIGAYCPLLSDDYCLTSDVDLLPFSKEYFNQQINKDFHIWSFDHYGCDNLEQLTRVPMCFNGAKVKIWKEIFGTGSASEVISNCLNSIRGNDYWSAWFCDEEYLVKSLKKWSGWPNRVEFLKRGTVTENNDVMAKDRIDRAHWHEDMPNPIDLHSIRPGHTGANWESLKRIFTRLLPIETVEWICNYREEYARSL